VDKACKSNGPAPLLVLRRICYLDTMYFVYIIQHSETKQIYIGYTDNLERRLSEHNNRSNKATNRVNGEWSLRYAEIYLDRQNALDRERKLKYHGSAKQKLLLRLEKSLL